MKKLNLLHKHIGLVLLWATLISQTARAQTVPDSQWARVGNTLAITTDGGIVTTESISDKPSNTAPTRSGSRVKKYSVQGNLIWSTGYLQGGNYIGGKIDGYSYEVLQVSHIAPTTDGGVALVGRLSLRNGNVVTKIDANGRVRPWSDSDGVGVDHIDALIGTPDGGFLVVGTRLSFGANTTVRLLKYNASLSLTWTKELGYPSPATPDRSLTKGEAVINTPDGGFLVAGLYIADYDNTTGSLNDLIRTNLRRNTGWVAKLDGQGNVSWQKLLNSLPLTTDVNGPLPRSIGGMLTATDLTLATDGNGYALVGAGLEFLPRNFTAIATSVLELAPDGRFKRARSIGGIGTESFITPYRGSGALPYYAIGSEGTPQISLINPALLPLNDPALLPVAARRTFVGPQDGALVGLGVAGDGGLVFASTANQVVKLLPQIIALREPTYDCQTGAIVFNTLGGDGSPITYSAPGVMRSSAESSTGTVESGLRNDPKVIPLTATQNGISATYLFDLKAACSTRPGTKPPVSTPIPNQSYPVGQSVELLLSPYLFDPTSMSPNYDPGWLFTVEGLPQGLKLDYGFYPYGVPNIRILGNPLTTGVYSVNLTASTAGYRDYPIRTSFTITVTPTSGPTDPPRPPTGGTLVLTQPTYDCQTGAIRFNTSGGDDTPIVFTAPGISRSLPTSPTGTVEPGLRNDPKPIPITALQNGQTATYVFDLGVYCTNPQPPQPPTANALTLLAPLYNCESGAITFRTSGGNGSPIEYAAAGITGWTTNPNQFVDRDARTANDVQPFTLMARQNGVTVNYEWNLKAACGRARLGAGKALERPLTLQVLGNPVNGEVARVEIRGAVGRPLVLRLVDMSGKLVEQRVVSLPEEVERQQFAILQPGLLVLQVTSGRQTQTIKLLKQ